MGFDFSGGAVGVVTAGVNGTMVNSYCFFFAFCVKS